MGSLENEIADWAASLPFYSGQEPPQRGRVRARATVADYKRKKHQQGTADNCVLSPGLGLPAPSHSPHTSHSHSLHLWDRLTPSCQLVKTQRGRENRPSQKCQRTAREMSWLEQLITLTQSPGEGQAFFSPS